jgi:hypothetical protein
VEKKTPPPSGEENYMVPRPGSRSSLPLDQPKYRSSTPCRIRRSKYNSLPRSPRQEKENLDEKGCERTSTFFFVEIDYFCVIRGVYIVGYIWAD